jgi:DNA processing protein
MKEASIGSKDYPRLLASVPSAPASLYLKGTFDEKFFDNTIAVVGSRAVSLYGEWVVNNLVFELALAGVTIVSGFMYGVDILAHEAALRAQGRTVAVMAGGVNNIVPVSYSSLYSKIEERGAIVSEFLEDIPTQKWTFVKRNRIVAGMSKAILVVEAAERSGSLITASYAASFGRKVFAIPGNINSKTSKGCIKLISEGADMCFSAEQILSFLNIKRSRAISSVNMRDKLTPTLEGEDIASRILDSVSSQPLSADSIASKLTLDISVTLNALTELLLDGVLLEKEGRYYLC